MPARFNLYFPAGTEHVLDEAKRKIPNLSDFLIQAIRIRLSGESAENPAVLFEKKFGDFESEAYIRQIFPDRLSAEQALKNRLAELKRACPQEFLEIKELFRARYPRYAKILEEL